MFTLTIFTPTYNRADHLKRLYSHLCSQTNKDFCWLIVDDGSTDDTEAVIESFKKDQIINIQYYYQDNKGKHIAYNKALDLCNTCLFICVDSDDYLLDNAVETVISNYHRMKNIHLLGFYYKQIGVDGIPVTEDFPDNLLFVGITDLFHEYSFHSETAIVFVADMIKNIRFPSFDNETFVTERVFYNALNSIAPMAICDDYIYVSEYLDDGYTKNANRLKTSNPKGAALDFYLETIYGKNTKYRIKCYSQFLTFSLLFNINRMDCSLGEVPILIKIVSFLLIPHYYFIYKKILDAGGA